MKKFKLLLIAVFVFMSFLMIGNVSAATASHATAEEYFKTGRTGEPAKSSDSVIIDGTIPSKYSFALGNKYSDIKAYNSAGKLSQSQIIDWDDPDNTSHKCHRPGTSSVNCNDYFWFLSYLDYSRVDGDYGNQVKNKFYAIYDKVGTYNGTLVDVKLTIVDFAISNGSTYSGKDLKPFIAFYGSKQSQENYIYELNRGPRLGVAVGRVDWVQVKYEFLKSGTNTPISVNGYTTYWDIDAWQGVHLLDNYDKVYSDSKSKLHFVTLNNGPYFYEVNRETTTGYNAVDAFTETFSGKELNRVYSFARPENADSTSTIYAAGGGIWNSAIVNGALKSYADDTPAGKDNSAVKVGDEIKYEIKYTNGDPDTAAKVTIVDTVSKGLSYVSGSAKLKVGESVDATETAVEPTVTKNSDGTTTLTWNNIPDLAATETAKLTYSVKVTSAAEVIVNNSAKVTIGDHEYKLDELKNPVPSKDYDENTPSGKNGAEVKKGNIIKYNIKYANTRSEKQDIVITDTISKGIEYVSGSASLGDPTVTKNSDGGYTLVWKTSLEAGKTAELTYNVQVTGGVKQVKNNANIKYGDDPAIQLNELKNPLKESTVDMKNTASTIAIAGIVLGVALIGGGAYIIYRRYQKA